MKAIKEQSKVLNFWLDDEGKEICVILFLIPKI